MTVLNKYHHGNKVPAGAINIMRGTTFGNPYVIGADGDRAEVIEQHRRWLWNKIKTDAAFAAQVRDLHGRDLCCCCAPKACHGDTLEKAAAWLQENQPSEERV